MDRATEIELMQNAEKRARARMSGLHKDPEVKASLRRSYERIRDIKDPAEPRRASR